MDTDEPGGEGELVRVTAVGICGSDLAYLRRGSTQIVGHEIAAVAEDGTPVAVEAVARCGACTWCLGGRYNLCEVAGRDILGMTVPGGMAEYCRAPRSALVPLPPGLSPDDAALVEPGAVAWHACRKGEVGPGNRVAVVGAGTIGLLAVAAALRMGAPEVGLVARHPFQTAAGERLGATASSGPYDVVIEASGSESGLHRALELVRALGTVVTVGVFPPGITWPYRAAFLKEARVVPSMAYGQDDTGAREFDLSARMLADRPDIARTLITHRFGLGDAVRAFEVAASRPPGTFKVVVHP
ncbi:alcohol dehydrogenase catalytic domain-containing protein [Streptomyces sp. NBC_01239]|uniref:zinc-dependent alcohol dehydrogenase n=1 Tax=Streptomyces sp. NBC_01239 TaxID=2903792 RepID=UPI00225BF23C|nr:alcohol dehydrogenase catalytic domain-containing protein [Streptomyces sp. NBC_01239]MCX4815208.1 alcohol dehydrogenase catalytic domain-containing protein [Streptomyces sp. NBC_01239]